MTDVILFLKVEKQLAFSDKSCKESYSTPPGTNIYTASVHSLTALQELKVLHNQEAAPDRAENVAFPSVTQPCPVKMAIPMTNTSRTYLPSKGLPSGSNVKIL